MEKLKGYRGIEYDIHHRDETRWEWFAYPKKEEGPPLNGGVSGTYEMALSACRAAIDGWLAQIQTHNPDAKH